MARDFDAVGDYIIFTKSAAATDLSQVSYSFRYVKDAFTGAYREIFWSGGAWSTSFHTFLQHDTANYMAFVSNWTTTRGRWSVPNPSDGVWTNDVVTYDFGASTNDPSWYRNGSALTVTERATPAGTADYAKDDGTITIGAYDDGSAEVWDGKIAEFAVWNRVLTSDEAIMISKGVSPLFIRNGLVFYSRLEGNTSPEIDIIGGGSGTVTGAIKAAHPPTTYPKSGIIFPASPVVTATLEQEGFRWRADDGSETTATWLATQDTDITRAKETNTRLRLLVNATNDPASGAYKLQHKLSTDGSWTDTPALSGGTVDATNLIENPSFETNYTDYWSTFTTSGSPTFSRDTSFAQFGSASFKIDTNSVNADCGLNRNMTLAAGTYYLSGYIKTVGITGDAKLVLRNTNNFNADINLTVSVATQDWTRVSGSFVVSGSTNFDLILGLGSYGTVSQGVVYFDGIQLTKDTGGHPSYFDGATATDSSYDYSWTGTAHNSTSERTILPPPIYYSASANVTASGENTTAQLTAPTGKTTADFVAGRLQDDENPSDAIDITTGDYTELEWCLQASSYTTAGQIYQFRVLFGTATLDTYTVTPQLTISGDTATTPAVVTGAFSVVAPALSADSIVAPGVITSTFSLVSPTASADASITAGVNAGIFSVVAPVVSVTQNPTVTAGLNTATFSLVSPTVSAVRNATISPAVITGAFSVIAPSIILNTSITPAVVGSTLSVQAPTISVVSNQSISTAVIGGVLSVVAPTITANASPTISSLTSTFSVISPSIAQDSVISVSPVTGTFSSLTPSVAAGGNVTVQVSTVSFTSSVVAPSISVTANPTVTPTVIPATFSQVAPSLSGKSNHTAQVITGTMSVVPPTVSAVRNVSITLDLLTAQFNLQAPTPSASARHLHSVQSASFSISSPTISVVRSITISADSIVATFTLNAPTIVAESSGWYESNPPTWQTSAKPTWYTDAPQTWYE